MSSFLASVIWILYAAVLLLSACAEKVFEIKTMKSQADEINKRKSFKYKITDINLIGVYRTLVDMEDFCNITIKSVLDVGANSGDWSLDLQRYFPNATFFLIEGSADLVPSLSKTGFPYFIGLVSDAHRNVTYYQQKLGNTGNSIFREHGWNNVVGITYPAYPIDYIVDNYYYHRNNKTPLLSTTTETSVSPSVFTFMKLDVQGAEVLALRGATKTLQSIDILTTELSVMNFNDGGATMIDVLTELYSKHNFVMSDIVSIMRGKGFAAVQLDAIFVKKGSNFWNSNWLKQMYPLHSQLQQQINDKTNFNIPKKGSIPTYLSGYKTTIESWKFKCNFIVNVFVLVGVNGKHVFDMHSAFPHSVFVLIDGNLQQKNHNNLINKFQKLNYTMFDRYVFDKDQANIEFARNSDNNFEYFDRIEGQAFFGYRGSSIKTAKVIATTVDSLLLGSHSSVLEKQPQQLIDLELQRIERMNQHKQQLNNKDNTDTNKKKHRQSKTTTSPTTSPTTISLIPTTSQIRIHRYLQIAARASELQILQGSIRTLQEVEVVGVTTSVVRPYYQGVNKGTFFEITSLLHENGFALYNIVGMQRQRRMLAYVDVIFVKHSSRLWSKNCTGYEPPKLYREHLLSKKGRYSEN